MAGTTQARKERERGEREKLILEHARRLLLRDGFQDLNLDELAAAVEYSKGTLYLHFETKEDLALAVITESLRERADFFERAAALQGLTRERIRAIGFACCHFAVVQPDYFSVEMMLKSHSFWERASQDRQRKHGVQAGRTFNATNHIVMDAVTAGDLPRGTRPQEVTLSLFAITIGSHVAASIPEMQVLAGLEEPIASVRKNQDVVCDGWGWKPLSHEFDYAETDRRIRREIFPEATWLRC